MEISFGACRGLPRHQKIAFEEDRSISGQLRKIFKEWQEDRLQEARDLGVLD